MTVNNNEMEKIEEFISGISTNLAKVAKYYYFDNIGTKTGRKSTIKQAIERTYPEFSKLIEDSDEN